VCALSTYSWVPAANTRTVPATSSIRITGITRRPGDPALTMAKVWGFPGGLSICCAGLKSVSGKSTGDRPAATVA